MPAWLKLLISVVIVMTVGISASYFTASSVDGWFTLIQKPSWNPPNWVFAPVWTFLYFMMGLALYRLWTASKSSARTIAISLFVVQMALNFLWSFIFFGQQKIGLALVDISLLLVTIASCIIVFKKVSPIASLLFIPYLIWVIFASALNYSIWSLNPS